MEENLNTVFTQKLKEYRVRTLHELLKEVLPIFYEHGFVFEDVLNALADYMNSSDDLVIRECVSCIEKTIDHLRKLQTGSNNYE